MNGSYMRDKEPQGAKLVISKDFLQEQKVKPSPGVDRVGAKD